MGRGTPSYSSAAVQRYNAELTLTTPQDRQNGAVSVCVVPCFVTRVCQC
jgi:hypothetical protein